MDLELSGCKAVVTGASAGIGRAVARELTSAGVQTVLVARREEQLRELQEELAATGPRPLLLALDICEPHSPAAIAEIVAESLGGLDILVNAAGATDPPDVVLDEAYWARSTELNYHAKRRLVDALLHHLVASGRGRLVNFIGSFEPSKYGAAFPAVAATRVWSKALADHVGREGVTVNCISPARIESEQSSRNYPLGDRAQIIARHLPVGRFGQPEEVSRWVAFLCSPLAGYITGTTLHVDGGQHRSA